MIDLHTHTTRSDGTDTPAQLIATAHRQAITMIGLTDHDTTAGYEEAVVAAYQYGIGLVRGIEMSAVCEGRSAHILGYLARPDGLTEHCQSIRAARKERLLDMVRAMVDDQLLTDEDLRACEHNGATLGRPHIADALIRRGTVQHRDEAFDRFLAPGSRYYLPYRAPDITHVIDTIHHAGGVAIWAHPRAAARGEQASWQAIEQAIEAGLDGVEVHHRDNPEEDRAQLAQLAISHRILQTGSSDYHGTGKMNRLGEYTTSQTVVAALADRGALEVICP